MSDSCMTLRVYRVTREGAVAEEKSRVTVQPGERWDRSSLSMAWPPCECPCCDGSGRQPRRR